MNRSVLQRTLGGKFSLKGKGLHTGVETTITFNPAPENHGYKIQRTDVAGQPVIDALAENVADTQRGTVLNVAGVSVSTIEHAMAALYALEVDNCLIQVDGPEFPILDGSSIFYIEGIRKVGITEQKAERKYISFGEQDILVQDEDSNSSMLLLPHHSLEIQSTISFDSCLLEKQTATLTDLSQFTTDFASARTFVFVKEVMGLVYHNLIKGGDLDNAIVIYDRPLPQNEYDKLADLMGVERRDAKDLGYIMNKPLLFDNEPARHKLLDIIGDIALAGGFIKGKIVANRPGHKINNMFAREIRKQHILQKTKATDVAIDF